MQIVVHNHLTNQVHISYDGDNSSSYEVLVYDTNNNLVVKQITNELNVTINYRFNTGHYVICVKTNTKSYNINFVVPAICRLSTGGCGFLISGYQIGIDKPFLLTANHCVPNKRCTGNVKAHFGNVLVSLDSASFWKHSERYKNGGIDYSCIGLSDESSKKLGDAGIYPHELSTDSFLYNDLAFLTHINNLHGNQVLRTSCNIVRRDSHCARYQYVDSFPSSYGGSSGSPVFGFNMNNKLTVQGIHIGHGKCTLAGSILADMKSKIILVR
jgi:hypothetical protein